MAQKGSTNTDWQQLTWLCYARTGKGKNLRVQRRKRSFLPFVSLRYNTPSPHDGRRGNSDGRATEVRKPEEKGRVFDALIPPVIHPACNIPLQYTIAYVVFL